MNFNPNIVTISVLAGAGGDDAKDWAKMLLRMYGKFADLKNWKKWFINDNTLEIRNPSMSHSTSSSLSSQSEGLRVSDPMGSGQNLYEILKNESGVHRLVRISPFDAKGLRHTSFALVEVLPELPAPEAAHMNIPEKDLRVEFYRSGGPGGQNVNKVETAVRVVHLPTGLTASSQAERSQVQNREKALNLLKAKLMKLMEEKHEKEIANLKVKVKPEWGHEIRSYVLYPYKQVKDHRTGRKVSKVEDILNGNLDLIK